jgi:transposase-like protein
METSVASTPAAAGLKTRQRCSWTAEERAAWVSDWEKSGETLTEFCRQNDLPAASLSLWAKQLRGPTTGTSEPGAFVEIPAPSEPAPRPIARDCVTLRLADRLALEIPVGADAAWVAQLVKTLN